MIEKKRIYESDVMMMPPLFFVIGDVLESKLNKKHKTGLLKKKVNRKMEGTVKRLISYLSDENIRVGNINH